MSIQTELTRIKNAKAAIKAAIEGKGMTVPDATLLDGMAALIAAIEAGGGSSGGMKYASGSYIPVEDEAVGDQYIFYHNSGIIPRLFMLYAVDVTTTAQDFIMSATLKRPGEASGIVFGIQEAQALYYDYTQYKNMRAGTGSGHFYESVLNEQTAAIMRGHAKSGEKSFLRAGKEYIWLVFSDWESE